MLKNRTNSNSNNALRELVRYLFKPKQPHSSFLKFKTHSRIDPSYHTKPGFKRKSSVYSTRVGHGFDILNTLASF